MNYDTHRLLAINLRHAREDIVFIMTRSTDASEAVRATLKNALAAVDAAAETNAEALAAIVRADNARRDATRAAKVQP